MLPLVFLADTPTLLAGSGPAFDKRRALLEGAGIRHLTVAHGRPDVTLLQGRRLVFGAGLPSECAEWLAAAARARGITVNIEDVPHLCDVHVPALVRRGDLLLTVSTGGRAPALAAALRARLESAFGPEWETRLDELAAQRQRLRAAGARPAEVIEALSAQMDGAGWLGAARALGTRGA